MYWMYTLLYPCICTYVCIYVCMYVCTYSPCRKQRPDSLGLSLLFCCSCSDAVHPKNSSHFLFLTSSCYFSLLTRILVMWHADSTSLSANRNASSAWVIQIVDAYFASGEGWLVERTREEVGPPTSIHTYVCTYHVGVTQLIWLG